LGVSPEKSFNPLSLEGEGARSDDALLIGLRKAKHFSEG
jgi:hypothetical protein